MFLDQARIYVKPGNGGDGFVGFRREKYVPAGGPAGGDGGCGGSVIFMADPQLSTLIDFRYKKHYKAQDGEHGRNKNQYGKNGLDLVIRMPLGTIIKHGKTGEIIADLTIPEQKVVVAEGGQGGRGNTRFTSSTRQAPAFAEKGEQKEGFWIDLELKLIADVGLVGCPNAGKSTLISIISAAKPKIADYPFTTLTPNLGVVRVDEGQSFVVADIPGLIEGAHSGVGLGTSFLRHVERTQVLIHVIDTAGVDGRDPVDDYRKINAELHAFNDNLSRLPQIIAANKIDLPAAEDNLSRLIAVAKKDNRLLCPISAATKQGIDRLIQEIAVVISQLKAEEPTEKSESQEKTVYMPKATVAGSIKDFTIRRANDEYIVEGKRLNQLMERLDTNQEETIIYLQRLFDKIGLYRKLREMNVPEGATVKVGNMEFQYQD